MYDPDECPPIPPEILNDRESHLGQLVGRILTGQVIPLLRGDYLIDYRTAHRAGDLEGLLIFPYKDGQV